MRGTIITGTVVREQPLLSCSECGAPTATPAYGDFIRDPAARSHDCHPRPRVLPVMRASGPIVPESVEVAVRAPSGSLGGEDLLNPRHRGDRRREARRRNG
jgi:hypothetical protein